MKEVSSAKGWGWEKQWTWAQKTWCQINSGRTETYSLFSWATESILGNYCHYYGSYNALPRFPFRRVRLIPQLPQVLMALMDIPLAKESLIQSHTASPSNLHSTSGPIQGKKVRPLHLSWSPSARLFSFSTPWKSGWDHHWDHIAAQFLFLSKSDCFSLLLKILISRTS